MAVRKLQLIGMPHPFIGDDPARRLCKAEWHFEQGRPSEDLRKTLASTPYIGQVYAYIAKPDPLRKDPGDDGDGDDDSDADSTDGQSPQNESGGGNGGYNSDEPRVPAGNPDGGQWTTGADNDPQATATPMSANSTTVQTNTYADATSTDPNANVKGTSGMDIDAAVNRLNSIPDSATSGGYCARYVENAIEQGDVDLDRYSYPPAAQDKGQELLDAGFVDVTSSNYDPQKGDVAIIQSYPGGNPAGHMAMWNGSLWVSDFKQRNVAPLNLPYPGPGYRQAQPAITYYRP